LEEVVADRHLRLAARLRHDRRARRRRATEAAHRHHGGHRDRTDPRPDPPRPRRHGRVLLVVVFLAAVRLAAVFFLAATLAREAPFVPTVGGSGGVYRSTSSTNVRTPNPVPPFTR